MSRPRVLGVFRHGKDRVRGEAGTTGGIGAVVASGARPRQTARRTSCWSCSTTWVSHSWAATGPTSRPRGSTAWPPRGSVDELPHDRLVLAHPGLSAHGPGPSPQRHGPCREAIGFPGYWGRPPRENGFLSEMLRTNGYATYAVGSGTSAPRTRRTWPPRAPPGRSTRVDRWYGFHGGETHQFVPALYHDNHSVRPPRAIEDGYHLSADLADRAIEFLGDLRAVEAEMPFFLYFATGACHSPHHAPAEWIEHYRAASPRGGTLARRDLRPAAGAWHRPR